VAGKTRQIVNKMTLSGIEPATFQFVAYSLTVVDLNKCILFKLSKLISNE
jgi:hypothetical protein